MIIFWVILTRKIKFIRFLVSLIVVLIEINGIEWDYCGNTEVILDMRSCETFLFKKNNLI